MTPLPSMEFFSLERNPDSISVKVLAEAFNSGQQEIQLPAFQRDAAWDEAHTELLWDSIVREFPISSLLFAQTDPQSEQVYKVLQSSGIARQTNQLSQTRWILVDGQQRSRAVALGLKPWQRGDRARIWVDLGQIDRSESQAIRFYVCTLRKPWGTRATDAMQREGLKSLNITELAIDDETLGKTWPVRAILPVPLADLLNGVSSSSDTWSVLVPACKQVATKDEHLDELLKQLYKTLDYQIPVFLIEHPGMEDLGIIFERLNKQGVAMSEEDRFFSALKMEWPQAHDLVWNIYDDPQTGRALSPTRIVHLAVRLAAAEQNTDELALNAVAFRRFIERQDQQGMANLDRIRSLMMPRNQDSVLSGIVHEGLYRVRQALLYDPQNGADDPGLPLILAVQLKWWVWHMLVAWAVHHEIIDPQSRYEMLRYACLDYFFTKTSASDLKRVPFEKAFEISASFPGQKIYRVFLDRQLLSTGLLNPDEYFRNICDSPKPSWGLIENEVGLVMWGQRTWLQQWFPNYDPTVFAGQDLPYDIDHIIPAAHLETRGRWRDFFPQVFWDYKPIVLHSPGNKRIWPKSLNRSDGQNTLQAKNILGLEDGSADGNPNLLRYGLTCVGDVRRASVIEKEDLNDWIQASNPKDVYNWSDPERILAFRHAVDKRRSAIYKNFFDRLGFKEWLTP